MHYSDGENNLQHHLAQVGIESFFLVHRLDTDTSGLMVIGKNKTVTAELNKLFSKRYVQKFYLAISDKKPQKKQGHIIGDLRKVRRGNYKLQNSQENPAYTQFFSYSIALSEARARLFVLKPYTGKTHQLRVSLAAIGAPILGDRRYGKRPADRMYLHAAQLSFVWRNQPYSFSALTPVGEHFQAPDVHRILTEIGPFGDLPWPRSQLAQ